jgi:hypothetical protein
MEESAPAPFRFRASVAQGAQQAAGGGEGRRGRIRGGGGRYRGRRGSRAGGRGNGDESRFVGAAGGRLSTSLSLLPTPTPVATWAATVPAPQEVERLLQAERRREEEERQKISRETQDSLIALGLTPASHVSAAAAPAGSFEFNLGSDSVSGWGPNGPAPAPAPAPRGRRRGWEGRTMGEIPYKGSRICLIRCVRLVSLRVCWRLGAGLRAAGCGVRG